MPNLERSDALAAQRAEMMLRPVLLDFLAAFERGEYDGKPGPIEDRLAAEIVKLFTASEERQLDERPGMSNTRRLVLRGPWEVA